MSTIKFRAGKVAYDVSTKTATALPAQGQIVLKPSIEDDSFFSFEWAPKDNVVNIEKDEFLIIPGDATWTHVEECKTGRVFALEFLSSGARHLFWMQEVNDDDDVPYELSKKDLEISGRLKALFELAEEEEDEEEEEEDEEEDEEGEQEAEEEAAPPPQSSGQENTQSAPQNHQLYSLNDLLTSENISEALNGASEEDLAKLYSHFPPGMEHTRENLNAVLMSPHFKRGAANLGEAMFGGGSVISNALGVEYMGEGIAAYVRAVKKQQDEGEEKK